ncbi:DUF3040 domain-containing protein [Streptomyces omiyaensis]|uniref:DUF3040 domain-containing protein n=1 Tax=Streptomyces omiyaensis TaxID=68247 RepID=A0ABW7BQ72_9ACTN|nr:DUF3040 domain-containing protein [Streptomyces omiyaensis]GGY40051.1 hypothetical protein GCM10010363_20940 [Streptomyces omiyaensis]
MDEARLSAYERRVLAEIEEDLSADDALVRRMAGRRPRALPRRTARGGVCAALLGTATLTLLVLAVTTSAPALIWAFAAVWVATLALLLRLVVRWTRRHLGGGTPEA